MSTLAKRLLTALILIPVVVWLVLYSSNTIFLCVLSVIIFIAAYEWAALSNIQNVLYKLLFSIICMAIGAAGFLASPIVLQLLMLLMFAFWIVVVLLIVSKATWLMGVECQRPLMLVLGVLVIGSTWLALYQLRVNTELGKELLMYLLLLIWIADSGAYFAGRAFGKHKLSPVISPGKSIEGVAGGLLACLLFVIFSSEYIGYSPSSALILLSLIVAFVSVFGDLFESLLKRKAGVKDSGTILPGHGGVLDRIDSLLAAAPFFVACLYLFRHLL